MTEFKKYNRKYIIIQNLDDASLPGNSEVIEEGIVYVYTPTGEITDAEKVKVGDGTTTFGNLTWLFDLESIKVDLVNPTISISSSGLITAKATQPAGYTSGGTPTKTYQLSTQGSKTITPTTADQTAIAKNRYSTGAVTVKGDANLIPANIKEGVKIFNVTGTYSGETQTLPFEGELTLNVIGGRDTIELKSRSRVPLAANLNASMGLKPSFRAQICLPPSVND